jgi:hypothetical protein
MNDIKIPKYELNKIKDEEEEENLKKIYDLINSQ